MFSKPTSILTSLLILFAPLGAKDGYPDNPYEKKQIIEKTTSTKTKESETFNNIDKKSTSSKIHLSVTGFGVAPPFARSNAQAYVLAKRAAIAEGYRLLSEKIKGVKIEGKDTIENMSLKNSTIRAKTTAMIKNAKVVNVVFKDGLCEAEMEIILDSASF